MTEPEPIDGREIALIRSEETVISSLLEGQGQEIPSCISRLLDFSPESFIVPDNGAIAQAIQSCRNNGKCPDYLEVLKKLTGNPVNTAQHLVNSNLALSLTLADIEAEPLLDRWRSRKLISTLGEAWEEARRTPDLSKAIGKATITTIKSVLSAMPEADLPPILDAFDFIKKPYIKPPEIVCGLLHKKSKMIVGGGSKSFKTWVQLDMGLSIAFGVPWLGFNCIKGRVLFVNFEIDEYFFQDRMLRMAAAKEIDYIPNQIDVWNLRGKAAPFTILIPKILERIRDRDYALVILDPVYKLYGNTDENKASDVAQLLNSFENLTVESGAAVGFGAHYSKGNQSSKEAIDRVSGSGVFARDPDTIINFTQHEEKNSFVIEPILLTPPVSPRRQPRPRRSERRKCQLWHQTPQAVAYPQNNFFIHYTSRRNLLTLRGLLVLLY